MRTFFVKHAYRHLPLAIIGLAVLLGVALGVLVITFAPSFARAIAIALPIPCPEPVTRATLPLSLSDILIFLPVIF